MSRANAALWGIGIKQHSINMIYSNPGEYCCITWAVGHYLNLSIKKCLTTLTTHSRSQISHEPSDILLSCTWAVGHSFNLYVGLYVGLRGPGWLYVLVITPRGDLSLWTPRARATDLGQGPDLLRGIRAGSMRATEPRAWEKTRGRKRKKCRSANIYTL